MGRETWIKKGLDTTDPKRITALVLGRTTYTWRGGTDWYGNENASLAWVSWTPGTSKGRIHGGWLLSGV